MGYIDGNKTLIKDIQEFETLVLNCDVEKNIEKPEIQWFKDGKPIKEIWQKVKRPFFNKEISNLYNEVHIFPIKLSQGEKANFKK